MAVTETFVEPNALDLSTDDIVLETHWDSILSMLTYLARRPEPRLTNKSGGAASAGDVFVPDSSNDNSVTTTSTPGHPGPVCIAQEGIANNTAGRFAVTGIVSIKVTGSVARGDYLETSSTPGSARSVGSIKTAHSFAKALTADSGGYCTALMLPAAGGGGLEMLSQTELTGSVASIDIQNIPQTFRHLLVVASLRTDRAGSGIDTLGVRINNDTGSNYDTQSGTAQNAGAAASEVIGGSSIQAPNALIGNTGVANEFAPVFILIPDYIDAAKLKTLIGLAISVSANSSASLRLVTFGGHYRTAGALTRLTFISTNGANFVTGSMLTLYGVG